MTVKDELKFIPFFRGTQRQFSENYLFQEPIIKAPVCSEDDLSSRIFGLFSDKFLACLPASPRIFELHKNRIIAHF